MSIAEITKKMIEFYDGNLHDINHFLKVYAYAKTIGIGGDHTAVEKHGEHQQVHVDISGTELVLAFRHSISHRDRQN